MVEHADPQTPDLVALLERRQTALTVDELASMLAMSADALYKQAKRGNIPHYRIASAIRFDGVRVAEWLRARAIGETQRKMAVLARRESI
jgi:excisionase family DNA binding protein